MGPLINARRLAEIEDVIADAVKAGARIVAGGRRAAAFNAGHFHEPTVLVDVVDEMRVFAEENFGPIAAITSFTSDDEALSRANASDMGLSGLRLHQERLARQTDRGRAQSGHGRHQLLRAGGVRSAVRRNQCIPAWVVREGSKASADYLDTKLAQIVL